MGKEYTTMEKKEQIMKKKKYIMPDITVIPMDEEVKLLDHISGSTVDTAADDSGMKDQISGPGIGDNNGQGGSGGVPENSKKNQMWDLWEY